MMDDDTLDEILSRCTRARMLSEGALVDVSQTAQQAGFRVPVAITSKVWDDCVRWTEEDTERTSDAQDQAVRLWDVIWMASIAARNAERENSSRVDYPVYCVRRIEGRSQKVHLVLEIGRGDDGEPVITILDPLELW